MAESVGSPLISGRMRLFLVGMVFVEASRTMTLVQVPLFLRDMGASIQQLGFFFTVALIFPLFLRILGGWFSDSIGRLRAILIGSISGILAYFAFFITPGWQVAIFGPAFIALTTALIFPSYKAYIADQTPEEKQGRVFGVSETVITTSWILGPPIGGFLAQQFGYRAMFFTAMSAFAIASDIFLLHDANRAFRRARPGAATIIHRLPRLFQWAFCSADLRRARNLALDY